MSIASRITSIEGHISDIYDSVELTGVDTTDIDKNLVNVPNTLKEGYIDIINNGTDTLYNNFPKVSGEGTSLTLNNTYQAPMRNNLKGNTSQTGTPTPTSPIPVNVVSGDNSVIINGKNWFDKANTTWKKNNIADYDINTSGNSSTKRIRTSSFRILGGKTYTVSGIPSGISFLTARTYTIPSGESIGNVTLSGNTFTLNDNVNYIHLLFGGENFTSATNTLMANANIMINEGSSALPYEPYNGDTYNIDLPSGMELCKIGNYQDYIYKDSDKWYLHKEIGKVVLNGSEGEFKSSTTSIDRFGVSFGNIGIGSFANSLSLSSHLVYKASANSNPQTFYISTSNSTMYIDFSTYGQTTLSDFTTWLSANTPAFYLILATPTNTEITYQPLIDQLNLLEKAMSKDGQTNISQVNNDLPFIISASALKKG